jgi:MoaA/NifB/PqqE/SkfB family radical SAM enzyme
MVTRSCNLNCTYCEDFGQRRNPESAAFQSLETSLDLLRQFRTISPNLTVTGGEPLLYPHIDDLIHRARSRLGFRHITLLTNALLLADHPAVLPSLNRLVISLDSTNTELWNETIEKPSQPGATITDNIRLAAERQPIDRFRLVINCVLNELNLEQVPELLNFCTENKVLFSLSPQSVANWPKYELVSSPHYRQTIQAVIDAKKRGAPVLGSLRYLKTIRDLQPFICYPTLIPRFYPEGALAYPCRPIEKENSGHGSQFSEIAAGHPWHSTMQSAMDEHEAPPQICTSCFQQCYIEPSLMQQHPFHLFAEWLRYPASRTGRLVDYSPG